MEQFKAEVEVWSAVLQQSDQEVTMPQMVLSASQLPRTLGLVVIQISSARNLAQLTTDEVSSVDSFYSFLYANKIFQKFILSFNLATSQQLTKT